VNYKTWLRSTKKEARGWGLLADERDKAVNLTAIQPAFVVMISSMLLIAVIEAVVLEGVMNIRNRVH